jgi:uncharacterized protein YndB with AHSA1/START domain
MTILVVILIIVAIPLIGAAFLSTDFVIEKEIVINKSKEEVFNYVKFLKNHLNFNKWTMTDPNQKTEYTGTDGAVGFITAWDSNMKDVGKGEQEIIKIIEGERIDYALRFKRPFENNAGAYMTTSALSNSQTKVTWAFVGTRSYPNKIFHFLFNLSKMLGKDLQTSLNNLKKLLEK